jgi:hypothetical protein
MKKGSTAAAKQSRNILQQKLTIGLDLGDRSSWYWGGTRPDGTFTQSARIYWYIFIGRTHDLAQQER